MRSRLALMVLSVLVPTSAQAQRVPDWKAVEAEAICDDSELRQDQYVESSGRRTQSGRLPRRHPRSAKACR